MTPKDQTTVHWVDQALVHCLVRMDMLIVGYINAHPAQPRDRREGELETTIASHILEDQTLHFIPRRRYREAIGWTWDMGRVGRSITGSGVYILGSNLQYFYNVSIR